MTLKELRQASGMTQKQFAEYFNIPVRNIENWESATNPCKSYLIDLMYYKLKKEGLLKKE